MGSTVHQIRIGGVGKAELLSLLNLTGVEMNQAAQELFADERFTTAPNQARVEVHETTVEDLGLVQGGTMPDIIKAAAAIGLVPCPLEVGPHFRLQHMGQEEGQIGFPETKHCAPPGSITIVCTPIDASHETPKGFYLRRINGVLWLRGYRSDDEHVWSRGDRLAFCRTNSAA